MLGYLSADIICSEKRTVCESCELWGSDNVQGKNPNIFLKPNINNSLHLARKYARIFVRGHYLFREASNFPRAKLEENCELRGTDNIQGQISEHIFKAKWRLFCLLSFKYFSHRIFQSFSWGIFSHVTRLGQSRASENLWWIITPDIPRF